MELTILDSKTPIRLIQEDKLNEILMTQFSIWISNLLSLEDEKSAKRLENALPAVKELFWSVGFDQIKKAFELYADYKLGIEPRSNYFDRVLVGRIFTAYQQHKPKPKPKIMAQNNTLSTEQLRYYEIESAAICFEDYKSNGHLNATSLYLYKVLKEKKLFNFSEQQVADMSHKAMTLPASNLGKQRIYYKKLCIIAYFDELIAQDKHIKDVI